MSSEESEESVLPPEEIKMNHDACVKELGLTEADRKDPKTKDKILACMFKKDGTMTDDGQFSVEGTIANAVKVLKASPEKLALIKEMAAECKKTLADVKAPEDVLAGRIQRCFHEYAKAHKSAVTKTPA